MAAGVNVALCPWLLYRSYICPVRESRHFTPAKSTGRPKWPFPDSFSAFTSRLPVPFQSSPVPISMFGKMLSRDSRLIIPFGVMSGSRVVYTYVIFWGILFLQERLWEFDDHGPADHRRYHGLPADVPHLLPADPLLLRRTFHRHMWVDMLIQIDPNRLETSTQICIYNSFNNDDRRSLNYKNNNQRLRYQIF